MPSVLALIRLVLVVPLMSLYLLVGDALLWLDQTLSPAEPTP
jgi:hypothetical protein